MKNREFYEKIFPEIKKAREERERFNRVGRMIKSDAEMEEVLDGIQEQEVGCTHDHQLIRARLSSLDVVLFLVYPSFMPNFMLCSARFAN